MLSVNNLPTLIKAIGETENAEALRAVVASAKARLSELDILERRRKREEEGWREIGTDAAANPGRPLGGT